MTMTCLPVVITCRRLVDATVNSETEDVEVARLLGRALDLLVQAVISGRVVVFAACVTLARHVAAIAEVCSPTTPAGEVTRDAALLLELHLAPLVMELGRVRVRMIRRCRGRTACTA